MRDQVEGLDAAGDLAKSETEDSLSEAEVALLMMEEAEDDTAAERDELVDWRGVGLRVPAP